MVDNIEGTCSGILKKIFFGKEYKNLNPFEYLIYIFFILLGCLCAGYVMNHNVERKTIIDLLEVLINSYSIIIGFTITSLSVFVTVFEKDRIIIFLNEQYANEKGIYKNTSLYKSSVLVFFEYLFSMIIPLFFILVGYVIMPYVPKTNYIVYPSLILFFMLLCWTICSVRFIIANLYLFIVWKAEALSILNNNKTEDSES